MANKTRERPKGNPVTAIPVNPVHEIVPTATTETIHPVEEKQIMEIHKHPHHVTHKKKWGEYLLEFIMLFLAVFLGFLAENLREHRIEKEREKQFIESFIEDLKSDTAAISAVLMYRQTKREKLDSLMLLLSTDKIKGFENELYYFGRLLIRNKVFQNNDGTITQLKNSGALRLIRSEQAADSIISYQNMVEEIASSQAYERTERNNSYQVLSQMFNPYVLDKMVTNSGISRPVDNPPLRTYDPRLLQDVAFYVHAIKGSIFTIEEQLQKLKSKALNTITFLQEEYHID